MLTILEKADLLQSSDIFREVRTRSLARVAAIAEEVGFETHNRLFTENEPPDVLFVLLEGEIVLTRNGAPERRITKSQDIGALSVLANQPQTENAVAAGPVRALRIHQQELFDAMAEDFHITRGILRALVSMTSRR